MRIAPWLVLPVLLAACAAGSDGATATSPRPAAVTAAAPGVYRVGTDVPAGVWTNAGRCFGTAATSATYDLMTDTDPDAYVSSSLPVGDVQRIVLEDGQFFHAEECDTPWALEDEQSAATDDPATLEGACRILLDGPDDLLRQTLTFPRPATSSTRELAFSIQDQMFTIVAAEQKTLTDPVGTLIDFLDDPRVYAEDGTPDESITGAVETIRAACADR